MSFKEIIRNQCISIGVGVGQFDVRSCYSDYSGTDCEGVR